MEPFGQRLKRLREAAGYSVGKQFAALIGIKPPSLICRIRRHVWRRAAVSAEHGQVWRCDRCGAKSTRTGAYWRA